ncbi:MAG: MGMT family protein [Candidatus Omnitrophica bacterium]|nr:MGMT family protein [Candidatus Omnitrophota bacterium]MDD5610804.1 MGMT family protein [Candidatus Omnitrophota bacterium]
MMTPFAKKVYKAVLTIPLGEVRTYKWVARKIGKPAAVRAVGQALKNNPYPLLIPCHRVVSSGGSLGGYAWGGEKRKRALLNLESKIRQTML